MRGFPFGSAGKEAACNEGDLGSIPGLGRSPGDGKGYPLQYSGSLWSSLYCGISSLCVGLNRWLVKVSWLGKLVSVFWWVELYFFSLECNEVSSSEL